MSKQHRLARWPVFAYGVDQPHPHGNHTMVKLVVLVAELQYATSIFETCCKQAVLIYTIVLKVLFGDGHTQVNVDSGHVMLVNSNNRVYVPFTQVLW